MQRNNAPISKSPLSRASGKEKRGVIIAKVFTYMQKNPIKKDAGIWSRKDSSFATLDFKSMLVFTTPTFIILLTIFSFCESRFYEINENNACLGKAIFLNFSHNTT